MDNKFTPLHIELMLHYHCSCAKLDNADAPSVVEYTQQLSQMGLIEFCKDHELNRAWGSTDKGKAFVEVICNVEVPRLAWVDNNNCIILKEDA